MIEEGEKKYVYAVIAIVVFILLAVIIVIWMPNTKGIVESKLNLVSNNLNYEETQNEKYKNILNKLLLVSNFDTLYNNIDENWLKENSFADKEEVKQYLLENFYISNFVANYTNLEILASDSAYIFKYTIDNNGTSRNVVVNEYTPYRYTISFDQDKISSISGNEYTYKYDNVDYHLKTSYVGANILQYELKVTNNSEDVYVWDTNQISSVSLRLNDGAAIGCSDMTSFSMNQLTLNEGGSFTVKVTFNISLEKQSLIQSISFANIYKNGSKYDVNVVLNGGE